MELKIGGQITNEIWLEKHDRANVWEFYAVTVSEDMLRVYRDGVLIGERALTADITALTQGSNYIGKSHYDWDANFYGEMDDISIYARVLTEDEIKAEYDRIAGGLDDKYARSDRDSLELDRFISAGASLPTVGQSESVITWECSDSSVIAPDMSIISSPERLIMPRLRICLTRYHCLTSCITAMTCSQESMQTLLYRRYSAL